MNSAHLPLFALTLLSGVAAVIDARTRRIPNELILVGLAGGALLNMASRLLAGDAPIAAALTSGGISLVVGLVVCAVVPLVLFRIGAMGGGDVKLLAVVGVFAGPITGMRIQFASFVIGSALALVQLAFNGQLRRMLGNTLRLALNPLVPPARRRPISGASLTSLPFGPAIFLAVAFATVVTGWA